MPLKTAILLTNLGTPERLDRAAVRLFLGEFLSDSYVVNIPHLVWLPILYGLILPFRSGKTLEGYRRVWQAEGSPLMAFSLRQRAALEKRLTELGQGDPVDVKIAMRYGNPSFVSVLSGLIELKVEQLVVLPLYPQFSRTTTETSRVHLLKTLKDLGASMAVNFIEDYHDHPAYIAALAESVQTHWKKRQHHLLMSFHGLPQVNIQRGDPYQAQCEKTAQLLAEELGLEESDWSIGYQSRFGKQTWIQPYTADVLERLAKNGVEAVDVICPGFSADCLETLDEIEVEYRAEFEQFGGKQFSYIPALNDRGSHITMMQDVISSHL